MLLSTFVLAAAVLETRATRGAARRCGRPAASVSTALRTLEQALSTTLAIRSGTQLVFTLEAERLAPDIARLARLAIDVHGLDPSGDPARAAAASGLTTAALERFVRVVEAGSIRAAAKDLGIGQPQLSRQIAHLERSLGHPLLERTGNGCRPSAAGARIGGPAEEILRLWASISAAAGARFRTTLRTVRLGSVIPLGPESHIAGRLATLVARWHGRGRWRDMPLALSCSTADELLGDLGAGRLDLALVDTLAPPLGFESRLVGRARLALVRARDAVGATGAPFALPSARSGLRQQAERYLVGRATPGATVGHEIVQVDSIPVVLRLVLEHGFTAILPQASVSHWQDRLVVEGLDESFDLPLRAVWTRDAAGQRAARVVLETIDHDDGIEDVIPA